MIYDYMHTDLAGTLMLAGDENGLRHLNFAAGKHPTPVADDWRREPLHFKYLKARLSAYFAGELWDFGSRLAPKGSRFQRRVWSVLQEIPYGSTVSYQWVAARIGQPGAARAVGAANGRNPIAILIPCHRVVGKNGGLTGYGGGLTVKERLIQLERRVVDQGLFSNNT